MSQRISLDEVRKVAHLARLALPEERIPTMQRELDAILDWMAALAQLDTDGVEPTYHAVEATSPLRDDVPRPGLRRDEALRAAARSEAFGFAVPKVMDGE